MSDLMVKPVDVLGDTIMAAKDGDNLIWVGVNSFCQGLDMEKKQRDWQVEKIKQDKTLSKGCRLLPAGVFDIANEVYALRLDFIPMWLAKITITKKMEKDHPDLADKLLEYQLKAKDILAEAFLPQQPQLPTDPMELLKIHYAALEQVDKKVDDVSAEVQTVRNELQDLKDGMPVFLKDTKDIQNALRKKAIEVLGGKESNAYHDRSIHAYTFADIQIELRRQFDVKRYDQIRHKDVPDALKIIEEYKPPLHIRDKIAMANAQQPLDLEGGTGI